MYAIPSKDKPPKVAMKSSSEWQGKGNLRNYGFEKAQKSEIYLNLCTINQLDSV